MTLRFFALAPAIVFKARVNASSFTYPISQVAFDGVTVGAYTDIQRNQTILFGTTEGGDDLGRQRTGPIDATADTIYFGRCSEGVNDGEVSLEDDAYITILEDWRVWSRPPFIASDGELFKDGSVVVGVYTTTPPPVANAGLPAAGTIDSGTGVLRVRLPSGSQTSFATTAGATITNYAWTLPTGVVLVGGYALTDSVIEVDADPGFHWIGLLVTDSNAQSHRARTWILARDPDDDLTISGVTVRSHRRTQDGQTVTVQLTQDLPPGNYPDGTLVCLFDGEPTTSADRLNLRFWGWHQSDPAQIRAQRTGLARYTELTSVDVAGRLAVLPGYPQVVENDAVRDTDAYASITWAHMVGLTLDLYIHYLLQWHSTALDLTDYFATGTTTIYSIGGAISSDGGSLWEQVKRRVKAFVPTKSIGCDAYGRLLVRADPLEEESDQRTSNVHAALTMADVSEVRYTHKRTPGVHWLRGNAIQAISSLPTDAAGDIYQPTFFCIAPGDVPGQGETEETRGEQLSPSQTLLNTSTGHHYARVNARESLFDLTLVGDNWYHLDPASQEWVTLTLDAAYAAQRQLSFTAERGVLHEVDFGYPTGPTGTTRTTRITWERETVGHAALTVTQPDVDPVDDGNDDWFTPPVVWTPPLPGDPSVWYGTPAAYILWDGAHVMRTWNVLAASPVWELVDTGVTGAIYDGQYIHVDASTVGMWLLTADGVWWCADIMATTPSWSKKLAIATVQAADAAIATGSIILKAMMAYASEPGYLIVATGPDSLTSAESFTYAHSYTWHTHDYGDNWTQVDMSSFTETVSSNTAGYFGCGRYGIDIYKSSPVIWCVRSTPNLQDKTAVFKSTDLGDTWTKEYAITDFSGDVAVGPGILGPFPDITDRSYMQRGNNLSGTWGWIYTSDDAWATATAQTKPAGYSGTDFQVRPNSHTFDPDHCLALWRKTTGNAFVQESYDGAATWTELWDTGVVATRVNTPNGWPPDVDIWFTVYKNKALAGTGVIVYTDDNFATTPAEKEGNLVALIGSWTTGDCNGFALPRVGPNA